MSLVTRCMAELERHLSVAVGHCRAARLRRVSVAAFEHWLSTPEVLQRFALHYQTGKPIPQALVDKIKRSATFNQGFATVNTCRAA